MAKLRVYLKMCQISFFLLFLVKVKTLFSCVHYLVEVFIKEVAIIWHYAQNALFF